MVMVSSPFPWVAVSTHRQQKANALFHSAKRLWTPLSGACSSHHIMGPGSPAGTENQTLRCTETQWGKLSLPFPPAPELCSVTRQLWQEMTARCKQNRGQNGWGYSGESCSQSTLPFHFRYATRQTVFKAAEPVSAFFTKSPSKHVKRVQQEGLKEVLLLLKAGIGTEGPQIPSGRWQIWCSGLGTQALSPGGGISTFWLQLWQTPSPLVQNRKSWLVRVLVRRVSAVSPFILFIFSNQWQKLASWSWKLSHFYLITPFYLIATSFCFATLTLHFPKQKCFISSYKQLFISAFSSSSVFPLYWGNAKHSIFSWEAGLKSSAVA